MGVSKNTAGGVWKSFRKSNVFMLIIAIVAILIVGGIFTKSFLTVFTISRLVRQACIFGLLAIGMTFVIAGGNGGIDLSVGGTLALGEMLAITMQASVMTTTDTMHTYYGIPLPVPVIFIVCIIAGAIIGLGNGAACACLKVSPFIVTMCMNNIIRGCIMVYTSGHQFSGVRDDFKAVGSTFIINDAVPVTGIIFAVIAIIGIIIFTRGGYGRKLFAVGANISAAAISGIKVKRIQISTYVIAGILACVGGMLLTSFSMSADPKAGDGAELDAISAVLVGGTPMAGGKGTVLGTVCGVMFIWLLKNLLKQFNVNTYIQQMIVALIIMAVVIMQQQQQLRFERGGNK